MERIKDIICTVFLFIFILAWDILWWVILCLLINDIGNGKLGWDFTTVFLLFVSSIFCIVSITNMITIFKESFHYCKHCKRIRFWNECKKCGSVFHRDNYDGIDYGPDSMP